MFIRENKQRKRRRPSAESWRNRSNFTVTSVLESVYADVLETRRERERERERERGLDLDKAATEHV